MTLLLAKGMGRGFWIFFVAALCFDFGVAMFFFLYNLFLLDLGFNERQLGFVGGAMTLGMVAGTIPLGMLAERAGLRRVLVWGFVAALVVGAARTLVTGEASQVALGFAFGACVSFWAVCFPPAVAKLTTEQNRTVGFSLLIAVGIGVGGLGGLAGGWLPGWLQAMHAMTPADAKRAVLLICCAIAALGAWPVARLRLTADGGGARKAWRFDPFLWRFLPAMALWNLAAGAFVPFATAYLARYVRLPLGEIGEIFSGSQMAQVAAILLAPAVFRRCGLVMGIVLTQAAAAVALAGLAQVHGVALTTALYLSFTAFHWMGGPGIYSLLMSGVAEEARSSASAANNLVTQACQALASAAAGAAYVGFGYPAVMRGIAVAAAGAAGLFWVVMGAGSRAKGLTPMHGD
ncbi:MAG: MFS transporter [Acidobacteriaceae bacterium]|jgi:MFS family permease